MLKLSVMPMTDIPALIARLRAATGPDREIDYDIWDLVRDRSIRDSLASAPIYTSSLDAAISLVPTGWSWSVTGDGYAWIFNGDSSVMPLSYAVHPASPQIALCIVAMEARLAAARGNET